MRGNDAGRGKPRLYILRTGPFAGCWVCKDGVSGITGYGFIVNRDVVAAREQAYDQWDVRSSRPAQ